MLAAEADAATSTARYTPAVVTSAFKGAGIQLHVYTTSGLGPGTYTWLRPGVRCSGSDVACVERTTLAQRLFVVVCPSAHATARVVSATSKTWETTTIANVVVSYRTAAIYEVPPDVGAAISRLRRS
jgi:hypothetical protein